MAKDYIKHYGVKKSQWSAEARNRYDAELRRKYGDSQAQAAQNQRQQNHIRQRNSSGNTMVVQRRGAAHIPRNLVKTDTSSPYVTSRHLSKQLASRATRVRQGGQVARVDVNGSTVGANQKMNYNYAVRKAAAKYNARFMSSRAPRVDVNGSTVGAGKKLNNVSESELKKREGLGKFKGLFKMRSTKGHSDGSKHTKPSSNNDGGTGVKSGLPKAGFIFKRPQARSIGKAAYNSAKKEAHKVKKANDAAQKEAQKAFERHKKEAEKSYAKEQKAKAKKQKEKARKQKNR